MTSYGEIKSGEVTAAEDHGVALDVIQIDGGTQSRAALNDQVVNDYADAIKAGATFPPIVVFYDGKAHWLADGFHRFHACQRAGRTSIAADIRQGTRRDAILHSVGANETHGLRRTNDDKRRAVLTLLNDAEWGKWTDREIARRCAVSPQTVANVRADTVQNGQSDERTYVHPKTGKPTTMKTAGINASRKNAREALVNDEPSPEAGPQAEASLAGTGAGTLADREGRPEGEAASVDLPAISKAERDADAIQGEYDRACDDGQALFLARNNLTNSPETADEMVGGFPVAAAPYHAEETGGLPEHDNKDGHRTSDAGVTGGESAADDGRDVEATGGAASVITYSHSAAPAVEAVADPQAPQVATAENSPDPHNSGGATAVPATQALQIPAQNDDAPRVVGQGGPEPVNIIGHAVQEDVSAAQAGNEVGRASEATVTNSKPDCLNPDSCSLHFTSALCWKCNDARTRRKLA
ncbi:ParB-like nuclease family protein [Pseudaminobacter salicylatoxidans]|uniref:ParB-like nuclease family protein n=1 Tax=Pseudaminobacter salicylatoxidans TaxID=93369 RepID=A0A316C000_PSESE|nr:ParB/RepB/Spo0J family partition protein [Pseudaminobacter salicylatoxidans]PWJ80603.1 ParB-like nuclease family protein [Pseudaminobacter salicylatoxidans]